MACYVVAMSRASSAALKHPPVTAPSEPAGALSPFAEIDVAIERERRRGRGAQSNASGRFEAEARVAFDDGWQSLDELPPFRTTVAVDTARKMITRNDSPDIGFDRSINPVWKSQIMFLICSQCMLCSNHEPSILCRPQAPAGHGALRAGGCAFSLSRTRCRDRARAAARPRRAVQ